ncbi:MAG: bifunctional riboflavin kinase/FAD synthetase [Caldilineae bacterium]|nr:MAG: bifunctional riboflavin kinase/FAD synthetase [Caldilineae bacterium]
MQVYESIGNAALSGPTYVTIGSFDGVHRGHCALISAMLAEARERGAACGLVTFHPHPRSVLQPGVPVAYLTSLAERLELYASTGLDFAVVHPFTQQTANTTADEFLQMLQGYLGLSKLWVGPDFALGRAREGDVAFLKRYGREHGFEVEVVPEYVWEGQPIRSRRIRRVIELGNVEWAGAWLGRHYGFSGVVVHGAMRGRTIGFPTANLSLSQGRVVPANGVYATWVWIEGVRHPSVTNIGVRPTVNGTHRTVEVHVIDFDGDLYGRSLQLGFVARLRDEMKFPSLEALKAQIGRDRDRAAEILARDPQVPREPRFEELTHTADWAIKVYGETRAALYANAALAMFALQDATEASGPTVRQWLEVQATDAEDLLVRWLSELLWLAETEEVMFQSFWVEDIGETYLRGWATGRRGRSEMAHIKAVTYHDLYVKPADAAGTGWEAQVVFDT